jgi:hypothetical protein
VYEKLYNWARPKVKLKLSQQKSSLILENLGDRELALTWAELVTDADGGRAVVVTS